MVKTRSCNGGASFLFDREDTELEVGDMAPMEKLRR